MDGICYICNKSEGVSLNGQNVSCSYCGNYRITEEATIYLKNNQVETFRISAAVFRKSFLGEIAEITTKSIPEILKATIRKPPLETIEEILAYVGQKADSIEDEILLCEKDIPRFVLKNYSELITYIDQIEKLGLWKKNIELIDKPGAKKGECITNFLVKLTLDGWKAVDEIKKTKTDSNQAFVAIWFDDSMDQYYEEGIKPALEKTGFDKIIMLKEFQHNGKIDDLIIASIRKSGLVIADFSGDRSAVYYEAGFALGLGIDVIWLCKDTDKNNLCFDTRQYSHIIWKDAADLKEQLVNRIEATIQGHLAK